MNTTIDHQTSHTNDDTGTAGPARGGGAPRRFGFRRILAGALAAVMLGLGVGSVSNVQPAAAASGGWYYYDWNGDGYRESAVYFDAYQRVTAIYMDRNRDYRWDLHASAPSGLLDYVRVDTNFNTLWDTWADFDSSGLRAVLLDTWTEGDGRWDRLISANGKMDYRNQNQGTYKDPLYGLSWGYQYYDWSLSTSEVSRVLFPQGQAVITQPNRDGDIFGTLTALSGIAVGLQCSSVGGWVIC